MYSPVKENVSSRYHPLGDCETAQVADLSARPFPNIPDKRKPVKLGNPRCPFSHLASVDSAWEHSGKVYQWQCAPARSLLRRPRSVERFRTNAEVCDGHHSHRGEKRCHGDAEEAAVPFVGRRRTVHPGLWKLGKPPGLCLR